MDHASQGKVWLDPESDMFMMAYEYTNHLIGNHIKVDLYDSLNALLHQLPIETISFNRTIAPINEGTPSFDNVNFNGKNL